MDWDTLVAEITTRHPGLRASKMFGMPCLGRVMKEWVLVPESQSDSWLELVEQAL